MALTRKYCEELGLTAEQMDSVLAEHGKSIAQAKNTASGEVESLKTEIESLKATNSDLMAEKEKIEKAAEKAKLDAAIDTELMKAGAHNPRAVHPFLDYDGVSFDKSGKLKGLDTQLESLAESEPYLFKTVEPEKKESAEAESEPAEKAEPKTAYTPKAGGTPSPKSFGAQLAEQKRAAIDSKTQSESLWR